MKKRSSLTILIERIQKLAPGLGGVLTYGDLFNLIAAGSELRNKRAIKKLVQEGVLFKIQRGLYATKNPDLWTMASRLKPNSYISMDSVLSKHGLIGTIPAKSVSAVYPGTRPLKLKTPFGLLRFFSIQKRLLFGTRRIEGGIEIADTEKSYLDLIYFYMKGARFVIDPIREVNIGKLDKKKIKTYLKNYRNPKFVAFVENLLNESD